MLLFSSLTFPHSLFFLKQEKKKTKNFGMIKYKLEVRMKAKRSFREKQYLERKSIQKAKKAKLK